MPVALISASTAGSICPEALVQAEPRPGRRAEFSHCPTLGTLKRFRERYRLCCSPVSRAAILLIVGDEAVGIDYGGAVFALADMTAQR